jgi:hypothetical protein
MERLGPEAASKALWATISHGSDQVLQVEFQDGTRRETTWLPVGDAERFERVLAGLIREDLKPKVGLVPRRDRHPDGVGKSQVFWASIENPVAGRYLEAFRPVPSLLFRKGSKRIAVWWLTSPLPMVTDPSLDWVTRGNKRLAYALKANSKHGEPEWLMPVYDLVAARAVMYDPKEVVGRLRDAPARRPLSVVG